MDEYKCLRCNKVFGLEPIIEHRWVACPYCVGIATRTGQDYKRIHLPRLQGRRIVGIAGKGLHDKDEI